MECCYDKNLNPGMLACDGEAIRSQKVLEETMNENRKGKEEQLLQAGKRHPLFCNEGFFGPLLCMVMQTTGKVPVT